MLTFIVLEILDEVPFRECGHRVIVLVVDKVDDFVLKVPFGSDQDCFCFGHFFLNFVFLGIILFVGEENSILLPDLPLKVPSLSFYASCPLKGRSSAPSCRKGKRWREIFFSEKKAPRPFLVVGL